MTVPLIATPDNPIPPGARTLAVPTRDGLTLRAATWTAATRTTKGTVCLVQGRAEFIEKYYETVQDLRARGFAVAAFDWRGQGGSDRTVADARKGHVGDFEEYRLDLEAVATQVLEPLMPRPYFGLAHSMGGAVCLAAAREGWLPFSRLVTLAPMLGIVMVRHPRAAMRAAALLNGLGLGPRFVPGGSPVSIATKPFPGNRLTTDPARYARNAAAALAVGAGAVGDPTVAWLAAAFRTMRRLGDPRYPLAIRLPVLVVAAGDDPVCSTPAIERFAARLKAGHSITLRGARHEILMEQDAIRAQFWAAFEAFVPGTPLPEPREEDLIALERLPPG
ncbi:alpha/beta hydrolase fold [Methylobacterium sp. 4-46]|uniref:alpha/beta fold hydrolase n=1 Tax=unclassified Methylobacterium TaxID=2615210 RepID=UPI000165C76A|nr:MULTISPECIES: alpha/beta hydrolase [Methylobacterium]ACA14980.1 alpha/beta hydrolase fold [Methylobacterium sp. 4-46]WFT80717.1 alpha/beta hydrolase [Methylobacterium nodulans]